jgi:hypothetical protein
LEAKLGYAQQSLLDKAKIKIEECRTQVKTGLDEKIINPTLSQIQQHIKTAQEFVDEAKVIIIEKKAFVDSQILAAKEKAVQAPGQAKLYVENSVVRPAQALYNQTMEILNSQLKTTQTVIENKAIYPGKVFFDEMVATGQSVPDKIQTILKAQVLDPLAKLIKQAENIYPDSLDYLSKTSGFLSDVCKQALSEIANQVKQSPIWDGKGAVKTS